MASPPKLRVFFIPFYATGHMIPILDLAFLFAGRPHVEPTLVTTPSNATLLRPTIDHYASSCHRHIDLLLFPFPSAESGLLPGQENISSIPFADIPKLCKAGELSQDPIKHLLNLHHPDAVIADVSFWWMPSVARSLGIPNIIFHAIGVFPQLAMDSLHCERTYETEDSNLSINLPGPEIRMPRSELPLFLRMRTHLTDAWSKMKQAQMESFGVVVNALYGMESEYCDEYRMMACRKAWFVGPTRLAAAAAATADNSIKSSILSWLDEKREGSVVFVCFGSWCNFSDDQLKEIALGLEASGKAFLWVVRGCKDGEVTGDEWVPDGWEERVEGRGMVVRGWGPQEAILRHKAVGAFVTHCGWNSVLEAAAAGVPVLTWPLVFEQFVSERLVVEVMGAGVRVWDGYRSTWEEERVVVTAEVIGRAVSRFMNGNEGCMAREKARELAVMAHDAVAEGGASWTDLNRLIDELVEAKKFKMEGEIEEAKRSKIP